MKKQLFLMAVVALAMASCSKDDSTGINKGSAIDFRVALGTRAAEHNNEQSDNDFRNGYRQEQRQSLL